MAAESNQKWHMTDDRTARSREQGAYNKYINKEMAGLFETYKTN